MKQSKQFIAFFLLLQQWNMLSPGLAQVTFDISNNCPFPIWPAIAPNTGLPVIAGGGFFLSSGQSKGIVAPYTWSGRIWGRTGCNFTSGGGPSCETGDCEGKLACGVSVGLPPVTLVQVSVRADAPSPDFYDVSLVDGYNLPVSVSTKSLNPKCFIGGCSKNLKSLCPPELRAYNNRGKVVACKSACLAFNLDMYCCRNQYASPDKCLPNKYSQRFKNACPSYFSYALDTPSPVVTCTLAEYVITFCPSKWGDHSSI